MKGAFATRRLTELGVERQCTRCRGFWPEDAEFFYPLRRGGAFRSECRACAYERKKLDKAKAA